MYYIEKYELTGNEMNQIDMENLNNLKLKHE